MKYKTLERYPNYRIFEDGTVIKLSTYKRLKHTLKIVGGNHYKYITLVDNNRKRKQFNITNLTNVIFKEGLLRWFSFNGVLSSLYFYYYLFYWRLCLNEILNRFYYIFNLMYVIIYWSMVLLWFTYWH